MKWPYKNHIRRYNPFRSNSEGRLPKEEAVQRLLAVKEQLGLSQRKMADALGIKSNKLLQYTHPKRSAKTAPLSVVIQAEKLLETMQPQRHRYAKPAKQEVLTALINNDYLLVPASRALGIQWSTLKNLINDYSIELIDMRLPVEEAAARLKNVKETLGLTIPAMAELMRITEHRLRMFLYPATADRAGYKKAPLALVEAAEELLETITSIRHRSAKASKEEVLDALKATSYRRVAAAKILGINSDTLNRLIATYGITLPAAGRDVGYGFVRPAELSPKKRLRRAAEVRAQRLGKKLYEVGKVYLGPVPGKGRKIKARQHYIAAAPRSVLTLDPRSGELKYPNMPATPYIEVDKSIYEILDFWGLTAEELNIFLRHEEFDLQIKEQPTILEAGNVYATQHDLYLAIDTSTLLTLVEGEIFIRNSLEVGKVEPQHEFEVREILQKWDISHSEFDKLVASYFPRPAGKTRKSPIKIPFIPTIFGQPRRPNPDEEIRQLFREYSSAPTPEGFGRLQKARIRAGLQFHYHDCGKCLFLGSEVVYGPEDPWAPSGLDEPGMSSPEALLGQFNSIHFSDTSIMLPHPKKMAIDFYFCPVIRGAGSLIARFSSEGSEYSSYPIDIALHLEETRNLPEESPHLARLIQLARDQEIID